MNYDTLITHIAIMIIIILFYFLFFAPPYYVLLQFSVLRRLLAR